MKNKDIQILVDAYLDGTITADQKTELENLLRTSEVARDVFSKTADIDALLFQWGEEEALGADGAKASGFAHRKAEERSRFTIFRRLVAKVGIAAAMILSLGILSWYGIEWNLDDKRSVASLTYESQLVWDDAFAKPKNGRFFDETYFLKSGFLRMNTKKGAVVSIAAPTQFQFDSPEQMQLFFGKMTARLSKEEASLKVSTDSMNIRDLGTAFGLRVDSNSESSISVFEGAVEVKKDVKSTEEYTLSEGKTLKAIGNLEFEDEKLSTNAENFNDLWPLTLGIDQYSPLVRLMPPGPVEQPLVEIQSNADVHLMPEEQGVFVDERVDLDLVSGGEQWPENAEVGILSQGQYVSSFLLFFNPVKGGDEWLNRVSGQIRFENEIVGIICMHAKLIASDSLFAVENLEYGHNYGVGSRGLESEDVVDFGYYRLAHDVVSLSEDRRSIYFNFNATTLVDQIRILVKE